jgi:hypothetical protein
MSDTNVTNSLVQTWVPVTDSDGRTHLEAHWVEAGTAHHQVTHAA